MANYKKFMAIKDALTALTALVSDYEGEMGEGDKEKDSFGDKDPGDGGQDVRKIISNDNSDIAADPYKGVDGPIKGKGAQMVFEDKKQKKQMISALLKKKMGY